MIDCIHGLIGGAQGAGTGLGAVMVMPAGAGRYTALPSELGMADVISPRDEVRVVASAVLCCAVLCCAVLCCAVM